MGQGSRQEVKARIKKGEVSVDGSVVKKPETQVTEASEVRVSGQQIRYQKYRYYMLNKPAGVVSATQDPVEKTVLDLLPVALRKGIAPVGRLDKDTVGLLLLTDDGELAHRLLSPRSHVDKVYLAGLDQEVTSRDIESFAQGITLADGTLCKLAQLQKISREEAQRLTGWEEAKLQEYQFAAVTISEGKYHQVKRMAAACGKKVCFLKRLSMGSLTLEPALEEGSFRELTEEEREALGRL